MALTNIETKERYTMPGDILAAVIQYLDTRPHGEVRPGIKILD